MWKTTSSSNKKAVIAASMMCFNTHAIVDVEDVALPVVYTTNFLGEQWSSVGVSDNTKPEKASLQSISDIVESVKITLGLPNKDIASIFGVSRQTLHSYKNQPDQHTVNMATMERALILSEIAKEIAPKFTRSPGAMAKNYLMDGKSLLDLLTSKDLDIKNIVVLSNGLVDKMNFAATKATHVNETSLYQLTTVS